MKEVKFEDIQKPGLAKMAQELVDAVVGMAFDEAKKLVEDAGCEMRLKSKDGEDFAMTMDSRADRVNFDLEDGKVVSASVS